MVYGIQAPKGLSDSMQYKLLTDPRYALAQELAKSASQQEVKSPLAGLAKMGSMIASAYGMKNLQEDHKARGKEYADILAGAQSNPNVQTGVPAWKAPDTGQEIIPAVAPGMDTIIANLMSGKGAENPDVQEYAQQLRQDAIKREQDLRDKYQELVISQPFKLQTAAAGATRVNVGAQEKEEDKAVGKAFGEDYVGIQKSGREAPGKIAKYDRLNQLLDGVSTGTFKGATTDLKAAAKGAGIDIESLGIKDDVAPIQAARSLTSAMALELRNPAGGAGMPGALSDKDREFLQQMVPGIETTPEGRQMMTETAKAIAKRDQEVAQLARNYRAKNGKLDEGFYDVLAEFSAANPLFKEMTLPSPVKPKTQPDAIKFLGFE